MSVIHTGVPRSNVESPPFATGGLQDNGLDGAPDYIPPRASRGRRSGVILPGGGQDTDTILLETVKAAPRRSSIIKVKPLHFTCLFVYLPAVLEQPSLSPPPLKGITLNIKAHWINLTLKY
uniref:Uncharacterized protein n=1 Tax=Stegastes partitus TaxID=144197 RepID=A0A3B5AED1_9TELE